MAKRSAGVLLWKRDRADVRVLLVHPGGPFWVRKDVGAWSIPKGEFAEGESALATARRELLEELGPASSSLSERPDDAFRPLGEIKQKGGKFVTVFALEADFDVAKLASNTFELEWPPRAPCMLSEVDRADWFRSIRRRSKFLSVNFRFERHREGTIAATDILSQCRMALTV